MYLETMRQLGLEKYAADKIAMLQGLLLMPDAELEKVAAQCGMTKEAFRRQAANFFRSLIGKGRNVALPAAGAVRKPGMFAQAKSVLSGKGRLVGEMPVAKGTPGRATRHIRSGATLNVGDPRLSGFRPGPGGSAGKVRQGGGMLAETPKTEEGAPWTLGRKLKWGLGLGAAGLGGYALLGNKGQPESPYPQQYYGPGYP